MYTPRALRLPAPAVLFLALAAAVPCFAQAGRGPADATVLIIRHAEKPDEGDGLTPAGEARAQAYADYFRPFQLDAETVRPDAIFAAADSRNSRRPRLTVSPLARALGLTVHAEYRDRECAALADDLSGRHAGGNILVCWHHGQMPELLHALGADPDALLPGGRWPAEEYNWVVVLRYGHDGRVREARRLDVDLAPTASRR